MVKGNSEKTELWNKPKTLRQTQSSDLLNKRADQLGIWDGYWDAGPVKYLSCSQGTDKGQTEKPKIKLLLQKDR